jgi:NADH-quinone oxidoreductase subunit M
VGGLLTLALGDRPNASRPDRWFALAISLATFVISLGLYAGFDFTTAQMQFVVQMPWIAAFNIDYFLGVDGISTPLILLTTFLTPMIVITSWEVIKHRPAQYFAAFLIMEGLMIGVFSALDSMLFYVFWEAMLIPMFIIIGIWGGERRVYATLKFFLYTFLGSVLMLVALVYLRMESGSFSVLDFHQLRIGSTEQTLIFLAFLVAFAVKVPMWPVHTWLPDAHVEAPTGGSVILAAVLLKMGGYGFIRFSMPITPDASASLDGFMIALSLIAVVYIGFVALVQQDMKKLIAYSSIAHMGFVTLGFFTVWAILNNPVNNGGLAGVTMGVTGAMVQMISHGLISAALFLCVGVLYDRMHSRNIADYGGVINTMPKFAALMVFFALANAGLPGTSGFVGEFLVILASYQANFWYAFLAATTLILGAAYTLWMIKRVVFGDIANDNVKDLQDMNGRESLVLVILAFSVLALGLYPGPLIEMMGPTLDGFINHITQSKL